MDSTRLALVSVVLLVFGTLVAYTVPPLPTTGSLGPITWSGNILWGVPVLAFALLLASFAWSYAERIQKRRSRNTSETVR